MLIDLLVCLSPGSSSHKKESSKEVSSAGKQFSLNHNHPYVHWTIAV